MWVSFPLNILRKFKVKTLFFLGLFFSLSRRSLIFWMSVCQRSMSQRLIIENLLWILFLLNNLRTLYHFIFHMMIDLPDKKIVIIFRISGSKVKVTWSIMRNWVEINPKDKLVKFPYLDILQFYFFTTIPLQ